MSSQSVPLQTGLVCAWVFQNVDDNDAVSFVAFVWTVVLGFLALVLFVRLLRLMFLSLIPRV